MGTKVKGLLRGLKYISQIFDEKEPEMEIGFPTDVKHVAHIGWEGPSASQPSWMDGFKGSAELENSPDLPVELKPAVTNPAPEESTLQGEKTKARARRPPSAATAGSSSPARKSSTEGARHSRRHQSGSGESPASSPRSQDSVKQSRRRRSASNLSLDSPTQDRDPSGSVKSSKHRQHSRELGSESPAHEPPSIPKHSRGRKSKGSSSSGGSVKSSKSKDRSSSRDAAPMDNASEESESVKGATYADGQVNSALKTYED